MIRNDFVSNSSSCSFIINNPVQLSQKENIDYLFKILSYIPNGHKASCDNGCLYFCYDENEKFEDIISIIKNLPEDSKLKKVTDLDGEIVIKDTSIFDNPSELTEREKDIILSLFETCTDVTFNFGLDDIGDKAINASAILVAIC